jgi:hypothetical protein
MMMDHHGHWSVTLKAIRCPEIAPFTTSLEEDLLFTVYQWRKLVYGCGYGR